MKFKTLATTVLFLIPALCLAGMYKYKDERGNWVYSQQPPANGEYQILRGPKETRSSKLSKEARTQKVKKAREAILGTPEKNAEKDKVAKETAKNLDKRLDNCKKSKKALEALQVYRRFKDKNGKVTRLSDEERATRIKNAEENIKQFCD